MKKIFFLIRIMVFIVFFISKIQSKIRFYYSAGTQCFFGYRFYIVENKLSNDEAEARQEELKNTSEKKDKHYFYHNYFVKEVLSELHPNKIKEIENHSCVQIGRGSGDCSFLSSLGKLFVEDSFLLRKYSEENNTAFFLVGGLKMDLKQIILNNNPSLYKEYSLYTKLSDKEWEEKVRYKKLRSNLSFRDISGIGPVGFIREKLKAIFELPCELGEKLDFSNAYIVLSAEQKEDVKQYIEEQKRELNLLLSKDTLGKFYDIPKAIYFKKNISFLKKIIYVSSQEELHQFLISLSKSSPVIPIKKNEFLTVIEKIPLLNFLFLEDMKISIQKYVKK